MFARFAIATLLLMLLLPCYMSALPYAYAALIFAMPLRCHAMPLRYAFHADDAAAS